MLGAMNSTGHVDHIERQYLFCPYPIRRISPVAIKGREPGCSIRPSFMNNC
jgi:hypothetical protein